jgi:hypothetical protein
MEEMNRRHIRMEASSKEGQDPEGAVAPYVEWNIQLHRLIIVDRMLQYQTICICF